MKVYVNELPKYCYCCPFYDENVVFGNPCLFVENKETCPLKSLSDYTKQVRKEVCEEIRQNAISHNNLEVDMYYITPQQLYEIEQGETK